MALKRKRSATEKVESPFVKRMRECKQANRLYVEHSLSQLSDIIEKRGLSIDKYCRKSMITTIVRHDRQTFHRFCDLPAELRIIVYEFAVISPEYVVPGARPSVAHASRQLRAECLPIFYRGNDFRVNIGQHREDGAVKYRPSLEQSGNLRMMDNMWLSMLDNISVQVPFEFKNGSGLICTMKLKSRPSTSCSITWVANLEERLSSRRSRLRQLRLELVRSDIEVWLTLQQDLKFDNKFFERFCARLKWWRKFFE